MAQYVTLTMKKSNGFGITCNSIRPIVIFGDVPDGILDKLSMELCSARELARQCGIDRTPMEIIREVCDELLPGQWDFIAQGGSVEF